MDNKRLTKYTKVLKKYFGFDEFRPNQLDIIDTILYGRRDVCAIMPTGFGKSLCYQFPAVFSKKISIVISPLISLMEDQKIQLQNNHISVCCLNSAEENGFDILNEIFDGEYSMVYMTPEYAIKSEEFFIKLATEKKICSVAIDESHCVSLWGHSFRDSYKKLSLIRKWINDIPIITLTATATDKVIKDITNILCLNNPVIIKSSFDRPNLYLNIKYRDKNDDVVKLLSPLILDENRKPLKDSIIIYCLKRQETENVAHIVQKMGVNCDAYHAGINAITKNEIHHKFMEDELTCIVATIAFGMGINKSNIRKVIHMNISKDIESYYQEIGRAGRDGLPSHCYAFYSKQDFFTHYHFLNAMEDYEFKEYRRKMIRKMEMFAKSKQCRRIELLDYFDEKYAGDCNNCDNCLNDDDELAKDKMDYTNEAKKLLGIAKDTFGKFGMTTLILILRGSKSKKVPSKYYNNKYYNTGNNFPEKFWKQIGQQMIDDGYLQEIQFGTYGCAISRTKLGEAFSEMSSDEAKLYFDIV